MSSTGRGRVLAVAFVALGGWACSAGAVGSEEELGVVEQSFSNQWNGAPFHEEITRNGLFFLREDVKNYLAFTNANFDAASLLLRPKRHFDDCYFRGSSKRIRNTYEEIVAAVMSFPTLSGCTDYFWCTSSGPAEALDKFAEVLHPLQDFYSHTNWVESGHTQVAFPATGTGDGTFPQLKPYTQLGGLVIVDGNPPDGYQVWAPVKNAVYPQITNIRVRRAALGTDEPALISGNSTTTFDSRCPKYRGPGPKVIYHDDIDKDELPDAALQPALAASHAQAVSLATQQTIQEWCRLQYLVYQAHDAEGVEFLCENWVANRQAANARCSMLPDEAKCKVCPVGQHSDGDRCVCDDPSAVECNGQCVSTDCADGFNWEQCRCTNCTPGYYVNRCPSPLNQYSQPAGCTHVGGAAGSAFCTDGAGNEATYSCGGVWCSVAQCSKVCE